MTDKALEILIRMIKEVNKLRGFTFYKDHYETPSFVEESEMIELYSLLNKKQQMYEPPILEEREMNELNSLLNKKQQMPEEEQKKELVNFEDVVKNHVESNTNLWKVIAILLKDVQELQKKFKQIEEAETKSL